jgi:hypothetical protein
LLSAEPQIAFFYRLKEIKQSFLQEAFQSTIEKLNIETLDSEAARLYSEEVRKKIAKFGLRTEVFLPLPYLIRNNVKLIEYYRLLYGISQKVFYKSNHFGKYKSFIEGKTLKNQSNKTFTDLIEKLQPIGEELVIGIDELSPSIVHELQLLTIGSLLRGSRNNELGQNATRRTFELIKSIVRDYITSSSINTLVLKNSLNKSVTIKFASDPDIVIIEELEDGPHKLVSVEIKGGTDESNAHNRLGEAEKSHQKAKKEGYYEFWTIVRIDVDLEIAKSETPTTTRFFNLDLIEKPSAPEAREFKQHLGSRLKIDI